jgi:hypothetical protein
MDVSRSSARGGFSAGRHAFAVGDGRRSIWFDDGMLDVPRR